MGANANERARAALDSARALDARKAARAFVSQIGRAAAFQLEACVNCGQCAEACHFYLVTRNPRYTPIYKLRPALQAYQRQCAPFASLKRVLRLAPSEPTARVLAESAAGCSPA